MNTSAIRKINSRPGRTTVHDARTISRPEGLRVNRTSPILITRDTKAYPLINRISISARTLGKRTQSDGPRGQPMRSTIVTMIYL